MDSWNSGFPQDITERYYSLWNSDRLWLDGIDFSLKDIFCLPNVYDLKNKEVDINYVLEQIILGYEKFYYLLGGVGSGKSSLVSYLCNIVGSLYDEIGIRVWSLPMSYDLIRIVMGECRQYAQKAKKNSIILVFENIYGYHVNAQEIYEVIKQRQDTWYPNISVIITCRESEIDKLGNGSINFMKLSAFTKDQIYSFVRRYDDLTYNGKSSYYKLEEIIERFGSEVIGNPVVLMLVLKEMRTSNDIYTKTDLFYLLIKNKGTKDFYIFTGFVAFAMFNNQAQYISEEALYDILLETGILKSLQYDKHRIVMYKEIISSVYKDENFQMFFSRERGRIFFAHKIIYEFSLANWIATNIINNLNFDDELFVNTSLLYGLRRGKIERKVFSFVESILKRTREISMNQLEEKWNHLVVNFIFEKSECGILGNNKNRNSIFLDSFTQEMYFFYNVISLYHSILRISGKTIMFDYPQNKESMFIYYLKLYSVFNDGIDIDFTGMNFSHYDFGNINLNGINLSNCILDHCNFLNCNMNNANLSRASFRQTMLNRANLSYADLSYANLEEADCSGALMKNADLYSANLRCSNLRNCDMQEANCSYANFFYSNLEAAICEGVNFYSANLSNAYLGNTILKNAYLKESDLKGAFFNIPKKLEN